MSKQNNVGAGPVSARKKQNGITLIALIITIIIMLILVGVTVSVSLNGGLFSKAKEAGDKTVIESEKEILTNLALGALNNNAEVEFSELDKAIAKNGTFEGTNGTYTSNKTGNTYQVYANGTIVNKEPDYVPEDLLDYLLGAIDETTGKRQGKNFSDIADFNTMSFKNVPTELGQLTLLTYSIVENVIENDTSMLIADFYFLNETADGAKTKYKFKAKLDYYTAEGTTMADKGIKEISYDESTRVGKYVNYDNKNWIVLYDDSVNGLQMISEDALLDVNGNEFYLGRNDGIFSEDGFEESVITEIDGVSGKSDLEKAMYSYDNMVTRLNNICDGLVADADYVKSVRSVGSNPRNPSSDNPDSFIGSANTIEGYGTSTWFEDNLNLTKNVEEGRTFYTIGETDAEYKIKGTDTNFESDFDRMVALGINVTDEDYWLASRLVGSDDGCVIFDARYVYEGFGYGNDLWNVNSGCANDSHGYCAVRPVVSLDSSIQFSGEGSATNPYTIEQ